MNKGELAGEVAKKCSITKKEAEVYVSAVFECIENALLQEEKVHISNFGGFEIKYRKEKTLKSPRTGEEMLIQATKAPAFKASKVLKDKMNETKTE